MNARTKRDGFQQAGSFDDGATIQPLLPQMLREFVETTDDFLTVVDVEGRFLFVNPAFARFFGMAEAQWRGLSCFELVHPDDRERTVTCFQGWLARGMSGGIVEFENRQRNRAGDVLDVFWSIHPLRGADDRFAGFISCARDITSRNSYERALQISEASSRALLTSMLDPMIAVDERGTIQTASDSVTRMFGYRSEELVGQHIEQLMPEPWHGAHAARHARRPRTKLSAMIGLTREVDVVCKDGSRIVCDLSVSLAEMPAGQESLFIGTFRDVTERKRADEALLDSERRFRAIFDQTFQYLGLLAPDGTLLETNQTAFDATGVARDEVIGKPFWEGRWWPPSEEQRERLKEAIRRAAAGEFVRFELEAIGADGTLLEIDFSLKPVKDASGKVVLLIPEGRDITEIQRARRAETAMLRAFASIGESAALLAHEIKSPITAVNVALRAVADQLGEDQRATIENLAARMQHLEQLMRRTLSFAKPLSLQFARVDAQRLLSGTVTHLETQIARAGASVTMEVTPDDLSFDGDPQLLEEVLANLVLNAVEAKERSARVRLSAHGDEQQVCIVVEDDGPGIHPAVRDTLFKPFVTTKHRGDGLGLPISRKIVEEHGGTLTLGASELGGARFELRVPARASRAAHADLPPPAQRPFVHGAQEDRS